MEPGIRIPGDSTTLPRRWLRSRGFNGARDQNPGRRAVRPRYARDYALATLGTNLLQWSPGSESRETRAEDGPGRAHDGASMEPGIRIPGDTLGPGVYGSEPLLQWS